MAKADADDDIRRLKSMLKESEEVIQEERCRVLKLTKFVEEISPHFLGAVKDTAVATLATSLRHINLSSHFHQSSLNLARLTKSSKSSNSREISSRKSSMSKGTIIEAGPTPAEGSVGAQLLSWMNAISKSLTGLTIQAESGHSLLLDDFLPPCQEIRSLETLKNGQQIARVIFRLITLCLANSASLVPSIQSNSRSTSRRFDSENAEKKSITLEKLTLLKKISSNPDQLFPVLMEYLQGYFPTSSSHPLERILAGKIESIEILLSELLFLWCGLDGHSLFIDERNEIQKLTEKQHHHLHEVEKFISEIEKTKLFHIGLKVPSLIQDENTKDDSLEQADQISFEVASYLPEDIYQPISRQIDDYFTLKSPNDLFRLFTELKAEIQSTNEFVNTVYLKEKLASNGLQYLIDTQRGVALNCIRNIATIEDSIYSNTSSHIWSSHEDSKIHERNDQNDEEGV